VVKGRGICEGGCWKGGTRVAGAIEKGCMSCGHTQHLIDGEVVGPAGARFLQCCAWSETGAEGCERAGRVEF
jgi:hypothetical protein